MTTRESIDELFYKRLIKQRPSDLEDWEIESEFKRLYPVFNRAIKRVNARFKFNIYSKEDIASFCLLKAHQLLRRSMYDETKNADAFFYVAFCNLCRDILRSQNMVKHTKSGLDVLDIKVYIEDIQHIAISYEMYSTMYEERSSGYLA